MSSVDSNYRAADVRLVLHVDPVAADAVDERLGEECNPVGPPGRKEEGGEWRTHLARWLEAKARRKRRGGR